MKRARHGSWVPLVLFLGLILIHSARAEMIWGSWSGQGQAIDRFGWTAPCFEIATAIERTENQLEIPIDYAHCGSILWENSHPILEIRGNELWLEGEKRGVFNEAEVSLILPDPETKASEVLHFRLRDDGLSYLRSTRFDGVDLFTRVGTLYRD